MTDTMIRGGRELHLRRKRFSTPWRKRATYRSTMYYGTMRSRARGNILASTRGTDTAESVIQGMLNVPITVKTTTSSTFSNGNVVALPVWQLMFNSEYWPKMKDLWEEVKITGVECKLLGNSAASTVLASGLSSVGVLVAVDRNGVNGALTPPGFKESDAAGTKRGAYMMYLDGTTSSNVNNALAYGTCRTKNWSPGNAFYQYISCYPSSMSEKDPWLNCDDGMANLAVLHTGDPRVTYELGYPNGMTIAAQNKYEGSNGTYRSFGFDPVLLIGVYNVPMVAGSTDGANQTFTFSLEFKIATCWRGPRGQKNDISENVRAEPPSGTPTALVLNYTSNTPEGGDVHNGLFNEVTVNVDVPNGEEIAEVLTQTFTEDTLTGTPWIKKGLYDEVRIFVKTKKVMKYCAVAGSGRKLDMILDCEKVSPGGNVEVDGTGGWVLYYYLDAEKNKWRLEFLVNTASDSLNIPVDHTGYVIKGRDPTMTSGSLAHISFYTEDNTEAESYLTLWDRANVDSDFSYTQISDEVMGFDHI
uniref:Cap n=1 Tax=CRESS DNA virus TaxID=3138951 RepID=A0AAU8H4W9_9VIRU